MDAGGNIGRIRHVSSYSAIEFTDMIDMSTSTPVSRDAGDPDWPWNPPVAAAAPAVPLNDDIDNAPVGNLAQNLQQRLVSQWLEFKKRTAVLSPSRQALL